MNICVLDIGTTSTRGIVYDEKMAMIGSHQVRTGPVYLDSVRVEQNPDIWEKAINEIFAVLRQNKVTYSAIVVTAQRSSVIPVDREGKALADAVMWQDKRTEAYCRSLDQYEDVIYARTGLRIRPIYAAPKMAWFMDNRKSIHKRVWKYMVIPDYIIYLLTGEAVTDHTYGNRTLLMDMEKCRWDEELLDIFHLDERYLCRLIQPGSLCGFTREGIPVYSAGGDQQCAALGLGVMKSGDAEITHGTGSFLMAGTDSPVYDSSRKISCNVSAVPGKYLLEASVMTTGILYDWFRENFYEGMPDYERINSDVIQSQPGAGGVIMLPHFQGSGSPDWNVDAKGIFFNLSLKTKRRDMARAVLEGIAVEVDRSIHRVEELAGDIKYITVSGGLSALKEFNQLQADIYNKEIVSYGDSQATAAGAWISCSVSAGLYKSFEEAADIAAGSRQKNSFLPCRENRECYEAVKRHSNSLYSALKDHGIYSEFKEEENINGNQGREK